MTAGTMGDRTAFLDSHRAVVWEACRRALLAPDSVVVLAELADTSGRNFVSGDGDTIADQHAMVGKAWVGIMPRQRLAAMLSVVWESATGTRGALEGPQPEPGRWVWVLVIACGGAQLVRTTPPEACGGEGFVFERNPCVGAGLNEAGTNLPYAWVTFTLAGPGS